VFDINSASVEWEKTTVQFPGFQRVTVNWIAGDENTDWFNLGNQSTSTAACWRFKTLHKGLGNSGKLHFFINGLTYQNVATEQTQSQGYNLAWAESRAFNLKPGASWIIRFQTFDGTVVDFPGGKSPWVEVTQAGSVVTIKAIAGS
jgi:hypothetical protein